MITTQDFTKMTSADLELLVWNEKVGTVVYKEAFAELERRAAAQVEADINAGVACF